MTASIRQDLARWAETLEGQAPAEILAAVTAAFPRGRVGFATGFGPEGCVLVDVAARARLPIDVFTIDTGTLFPETYALWNRLEARYGVSHPPRGEPRRRTSPSPTARRRHGRRMRIAAASSARSCRSGPSSTASTRG